jgi:hypothetical protein
MTLTIFFPGTQQASLAEVGGKGYSLIRMVEVGLPVPPGAVLTTAFFAPWFDAIRASATWTMLADKTPDKWATLCNELKGLCPALPLTESQRQALEDLRQNLAALGDDVLFAVRSSSPEEDLVVASFAGGYETKLGVRGPELLQVLKHCFTSTFDERVFVYKWQHGFDVLSRLRRGRHRCKLGAGRVGRRRAYVARPLRRRQGEWQTRPEEARRQAALDLARSRRGHCGARRISLNGPDLE